MALSYTLWPQYEKDWYNRAKSIRAELKALRDLGDARDEAQSARLAELEAQRESWHAEYVGAKEAAKAEGTYVSIGSGKSTSGTSTRSAGAVTRISANPADRLAAAETRVQVAEANVARAKAAVEATEAALEAAKADLIKTRVETAEATEKLVASLSDDEAMQMLAQRLGVSVEQIRITSKPTGKQAKAS